MSESNNKRLVILDAHAILHRAYHALPGFVSANGEPTGALYGLVTMLMKIINELQPDYLLACFDLPQITFRKEIYGAYKAGRPKTEPELIAQIKRSRDVFRAFGVTCFELAGYEADDLIGTIVEQFKDYQDLEIIIASGDMDTLQLVSGERVRVYTLKKGLTETIIYDERRVVERFGFLPKYLPDYKGLAGDPSDNIIGVSGIGDKTAAKLVGALGSLEDIYQHLKGNTPAWQQLGLKPRVVNLLRDNEEEALFSKSLATIRREAPIFYPMPEETWRDNLVVEDIKTLFTELDFRSLFGRLDSLLSKLQVVTSPTEPVVVDELSAEDFYQLSLMVWLLNSELTEPQADDIRRVASAQSWTEVRTNLWHQLEQANLLTVYQEIELPLRPILLAMSRRGILIDQNYLEELSQSYHQRLSVLVNEIYQLAGGAFNLNSPKQLAEVLFDRLGLKIKGARKTPGGARSTRESELLKLADSQPVVAKIIKYRELQKLLSTYIDNLPKMLGTDGRLHTTFNQTGTTTGRLSSVNPNLQNIPIRGDFGPEIRNAFVAEAGRVFVAFDYSQIEMRILAMLSADDELLAIFKNDQDIHQAVAAKVFGVALTEVSSEMRRRAKVINFGIIYGMGVSALSRAMGASRQEAQNFYDDYFLSFPKIKNYFDQVVDQVKKLGYTQTYFGRRRYFPTINSPLPQLRAMAERMAMNAPVQGTAADLIKRAMVLVGDRLEKVDWVTSVDLLLQIHDELLFEVAEDRVNDLVALVRPAMAEALIGPVTFPVEVKVGRRWGQLTALK